MQRCIWRLRLPTSATLCSPKPYLSSTTSTAMAFSFDCQSTPNRRRRRRPMTIANPSSLSPVSTAPSPIEPVPPSAAPATSVVHQRTSKPRHDVRESVVSLKYRLDMCSKSGDLPEAFRLYEEARAESVGMLVYHYNVLLYLCSSLPSQSSGQVVPQSIRLDRGFQIFRQMEADGVVPNEATFTSMARLAALKEDSDLAFEMIRRMQASGISPKLRSYGPALFGFCSKGEVEKAYQVEQHMADCGVLPEDAELAALIRASSDAERGDHVYRLLHKLRYMVRQVSESTAGDVEKWFESDAAGRVGEEEWDVKKVKERVVKGGGGWHGQGWLGKGKWSVGRTEVDAEGVCRRCGERLVCIDIDPSETENFARSLSNLACKKEVKTDFLRFQEWLAEHGPYDAVIDGANVGLYQQSKFSFSQINNIANRIREKSSSKRMPLIILHSRRTKGGSADTPNNKKLIERWRKSGMLYATPFGSNDDWYWLYAAVSCRSLLVTNDEMRDHLFQLLGNSFFPRWKEKHQVRLTLSKRVPQFHMPPPYSIVIQESEAGGWHVPTVSGDEVETPRQWVCARRAAVTNTSSFSVDDQTNL